MAKVGDASTEMRAYLQQTLSDKSTGGKKVTAEELKTLTDIALKSGTLEKEEIKILVTAALGTDAKEIAKFKSSIDPVNKDVADLMEKVFNSVTILRDGQKAQTFLDKSWIGQLWSAARTTVGFDALSDFELKQVEEKVNSAASKEIAPYYSMHQLRPAEANTCAFLSSTSVFKDNADVMKNLTTEWKNVDNKHGMKFDENFLNNTLGCKPPYDSAMAHAYSKSELKDLMAGQEGKAFIKVGSHVMVFKGIDKEGNVLAYDPINNKTQPINPQNQSLVLYIQGKQDPKGTTEGYADKSVKTYDQLKDTPESEKLFSDKNSAESFNVRKLFFSLGEKDFTLALDKALKKPDSFGEVKKLLESRGMSLDDREIKAMMTVLSSPVDGGQRLIDKFKNLDSIQFESKRAGSNETIFKESMQFTDVDLKDYFSKGGDATEQAGRISDILMMILKGNAGC